PTPFPPRRSSLPLHDALPISWLPDLVRDEITRLSARAAATTTIAIGVVAPSAAVTAPATNPTRDQWLADFMKLKRMNVLISQGRSEEHTSELQSRGHLVCRLL